MDVAGRRTRIDESDGTVRQYGYDAVDRLVSETVSGALSYGKTFTCDAVGNRLTQETTGSSASSLSYTYDNRDQLTLENATAYSYNLSGNLTSKTGDATYTWDFENRLKSVTLANGTVVSHEYDVDGNRVATTVTPAGGTPTATKYLVDATQGLSQVVADLDAAGNLQAYYVRAGSELLAVLRPTATTYTARYVHADGLGSIRAITDESGVVTDTRAYEAFGLMNQHAGTEPVPYGFAGEAYEPESKLAYHRARWMDARVGRFLGMDPLLAQAPANPNLDDETALSASLWTPTHVFAYTRGDPVSHWDPSGLEDGISLGAGSLGGNILSMMARVSAQAEARSLVFYGRAYGIAGASARILARELEAIGDMRSWGQAAHHIVAGAHPMAQASRDILLKFGVGINDAVNGVFLVRDPRFLTQGYSIMNNAAVHAAVHTERYFLAVEKLLENASSREEAVAILQQIRYGLLAGSFP